MNHTEKLNYLKDNHLGIFLRTRGQIFQVLSERQGAFCCCGRLATSLHEHKCTKFNNAVDEETINSLSDLLP